MWNVRNAAMRIVLHVATITAVAETVVITVVVIAATIVAETVVITATGIKVKYIYRDIKNARKSGIFYWVHFSALHECDSKV